jgi:hypothetical protein
MNQKRRRCLFKQWVFLFKEIVSELASTTTCILMDAINHIFHFSPSGACHTHMMSLIADAGSTQRNNCMTYLEEPEQIKMSRRNFSLFYGGPYQMLCSI